MLFKIHDQIKNYIIEKLKVMSPEILTDNFTNIVLEPPFFYCKDENYQYIICVDSGRVIYKKEYTPYSESFFCFCGNTKKGPVFCDTRYSTYLYPKNGTYAIHSNIFCNSVIVNNQNVLNITENENGIGVIDPYGKTIIENNYDSVNVELLITAEKGSEKEQKIIPFQKFNLEKELCME